MTAPLHCELFIILNMAESHWGSRVPHPSQHLIYSSVLQQMWSSLSKIFFAIFFILFLSTVNKSSKETHSKGCLTIFGWASSCWTDNSHTQQQQWCVFCFCGPRTEKNAPHRIHLTDWYRAQTWSESPDKDDIGAIYWKEIKLQKVLYLFTHWWSFPPQMFQSSQKRQLILLRWRRASLWF